MESPQGVNREVPKPPARPIVEYDPSLQKESVPYEVYVDSEKCAELFQKLGLSDEAISKFKIKLEKGKLDSAGELASYSHKNGGDLITVNTNSLWWYYEKHKEHRNRIRKTDEGNDQNSTTLYLEKIKPSVVHVLLHEAKHASEARTKKAKNLESAIRLVYYFGGIFAVGVAIDRLVPIAPLNLWLSPLAIFSAPLLYMANPSEIRARRFAAMNRNDPRWENILTITPKEKQV